MEHVSCQHAALTGSTATFLTLKRALQSRHIKTLSFLGPKTYILKWLHLELLAGQQAAKEKLKPYLTELA